MEGSVCVLVEVVGDDWPGRQIWEHFAEEWSEGDGILTEGEFDRNDLDLLRQFVLDHHGADDALAGQRQHSFYN